MAATNWASRSQGSEAARCEGHFASHRAVAKNYWDLMKRLVLFSPGHTEPGGAATRSRLIAATLVKHGWQIHAVTRAGSLSVFRLHRSPNLTVLEVPGFGRRRLGGALFILVAVPVGLVWGIRARALIAIRLASPATAAAVCGRLLRRPYLAWTSKSGLQGEVRYILSTRTPTLRRWLLRDAAFLVAQTDFAAGELESLLPGARIAVIPNPVLNVGQVPLDGRPHAVYTGRLSAEKDLVRLLSAWRAILQELPEAQLTLVGTGSAHRSVEHDLKSMIARDPLLGGGVTLTGWVNDTGEYLRRSDIYVFPSLEEGMSNALLEACAYRRIIVASDIGPNREVLGDEYPLLFRGGDTEDLVATLRCAFLNDRVRSKAQQHIGRRIREFSADAIIVRLEALIEAAGQLR
jgi:glycosyltransferase involved in cell wall biosynthesis